jgi:hypothetical protein
VIEHLQMVQQTQLKTIQRQAEQRRQFQNGQRKTNRPRLLNWLTSLI